MRSLATDNGNIIMLRNGKVFARKYGSTESSDGHTTQILGIQAHVHVCRTCILKVYFYICLLLSITAIENCLL